MITYLALIKFYAGLMGFDPDLVTAVIKTESNFNQKAIGPSGEIGLMQLHPKFFDKSLSSNPRTNIILGIEHLNNVRKGCKHKGQFTFLVCYNRGVAGGNKVVNPLMDDYVIKVKGYYNEIKLNSYGIIKHHTSSRIAKKSSSGRYRNVSAQR